ncbi:MAG: hypothetical protein COB30_012595 [Ectothiorhodospiraceae bacterium]|nr:hypothetical protein [Ectothiorhodospiraceae bacterium]
MSKLIDEIEFRRLIGEQLDITSSDSFYIVSRGGIEAKPTPQEDLDSLCQSEIAILKEFERDALLKFPCTKKQFLAWAELQGGIYLPDGFEEGKAKEETTVRASYLVDFFRSAIQKNQQLKESGETGFLDCTGKTLDCYFFPRDFYTAVSDKYPTYARHHWKDVDKTKVLTGLGYSYIRFYAEKAKKCKDSPERESFIEWAK